VPPAATKSMRHTDEAGLCCCLVALMLLTPTCILGTRAIAQTTPSSIAAARSAMAAGVTAANAGNLAEAKRQFARAVALAPKIPEGHAALGSVLLSLGEFNAAVDELDRAHKLAPANATIDLNLANAEVSVGRYADAVKLFREALASDARPSFTPQDSIAFATALAATGDSTGAEATLRVTAAATPDSSELHDAFGVMLAKRGAMDAALQQFQQAVALNPSLIQAQNHLGVALLALNRPEDAIGPLQLAATADPKSFDTQLQLGRALSSLHRDAEALNALHHATQLRTSATSPDALYALALALQASGDAPAALTMFDAATSSGTPTGAALTNYALARVQTGDAKGALPLYARALAMGPDSTTLREDYGVAYLQQSDLDHAIEQFRAGLQLDPDDAHLHYDLGLALKLKDNLAAAVPEFERAAELDATLPDPAYTLGVIYMQQGRFADAATQLRRATTLQPSNGDAWALLGSVLKDSGDATGAADALKRAIALQPDQPSLHIQLATLELQAGDKDAAAADRKIAADLSRAAVNRQRASFALKSGRALLADGKLDEAVVQLIVATQADPTLAEPHRLLADAYARQGKAADAALERRTADSLDAGKLPPNPAQP
jgi:protein O-GlcNAc transferase